MSTFLTNINYQSQHNKQPSLSPPKQQQPETHQDKQQTQTQIDITTKPPFEQLKIIEEKYLNFSIEQNTKNSDFEKIESKYLSIIIDKYNTYNSNKFTISTLKSQYSDLLKKIQKELTLYYSPGSHILTQYDNEISSLKKIIKQKTYEMDVYKHMHDKLYHKNYLIKKRVDTEIKTEGIITKQHSSYKIIQSQALLTCAGHNQKLDLMKQYYDSQVEQNKTLLLKKAKIVNNLDYQIEELKIKMKQFDDEIKELNNKQIDIQKQINDKQHQLQLIQNDYLIQRKDYHNDCIKLRKMLSFSNIKNINDLINIFNTQSGHIESLRSQFTLYNKEIIKQQEQLTKYENEIGELNIKMQDKDIKAKRKDKEVQQQKNITFLKNQLTNAENETNNVNMKIKSKICHLQSIVAFCRKGIMKIINELSSTKPVYCCYNNNGDMYCSSNNVNYGLNKFLDLMLNKNKDVSLDVGNIDMNLQHILITVCYLISLFSNYFATFYYNATDNIHKADIKAEELAIIEEQQHQKQLHYYHNNSSNSNSKFYNNSNHSHHSNAMIKKDECVQIKNLFDEHIADKYYMNLNGLINQIENKNRTLKIKEQELLNNLNMNDGEHNNNNNDDHVYNGSNSNNNNTNKDKNELYDKFMSYLDKEGINVGNSNSNSNNNAQTSTNRKHSIITYKHEKQTKKLKQNSYTIDASKRRSSSTMKSHNNIHNNNNNLEHSMSLSSTYFSSTLNNNNKSFIHNHPKKVIDIMKKYQNDLTSQDAIKKNQKPKLTKASSLLQPIISPSISKNILNRTLSHKHTNIRHKISSLDKLAFPRKKIYYYYDNEEPDITEVEEEKERIDNILKENEELNTKRNEYKYFKDNKEMAGIFKRLNDLRSLDLEYSKKKDSLNPEENPYEIFFNFERKYLKKDKLYHKRFKHLDPNKEAHSMRESLQKKESTMLSNNDSQQVDSYNSYIKKTSQVMNDNNNNISQGINRKHQILSNNLHKIFNISLNYLPN